MKTLGLLLVACLVSVASLRREPVVPLTLSPDPTGTWQWSTKKGNGELRTTLKLDLRDSKIAGL